MGCDLEDESARVQEFANQRPGLTPPANRFMARADTPSGADQGAIINPVADRIAVPEVNGDVLPEVHEDGELPFKASHSEVWIGLRTPETTRSGVKGERRKDFGAAVVHGAPFGGRNPGG